jgi:hypothetical protein
MEIFITFLGNKLFEILQKISSGWKPTHLTSVFALQTSILLPDGTTLTAFADVNTDVARC